MRSAAALLVGVALSASAGCGFQPLYAGGSGSPVAQALSGVGVNAPDTRVGQLLREQVEDEVGKRAGAQPAYRLDVAIDERRFGRGLRRDQTVNRFELRLTVKYRLVSLQRNGAVLTSGEEPVYVTYDVAEQPYAGVVAHQDGEERAASEAAVRIRQNLQRFFASRSAGADGGPALAR